MAYLPTLMLDFCCKLLGKCTSPMDPMAFHSFLPFLTLSKNPSMLGVPEVYHVFHHGFRCPSETCLQRYLDVTPWKLKKCKSGTQKMQT